MKIEYYVSIKDTLDEISKIELELKDVNRPNAIIWNFLRNLSFLNYDRGTDFVDMTTVNLNYVTEDYIEQLKIDIVDSLNAKLKEFKNSLPFKEDKYREVTSIIVELNLLKNKLKMIDAIGIHCYKSTFSNSTTNYLPEVIDKYYNNIKEPIRQELIKLIDELEQKFKTLTEND